MLKSKVTKKVLLEGAKICKEFGYWSNEVNTYLDQFEHCSRTKISSALYSVYISHQRQASMYYDLFLENNLV